MRSLLFAMLAMGTMSPAWAQTTASVQAPGSASAGASASQDTKASGGTVADADKAIRCRKVVVTGSLVKKGRVCKSVAEWRKMMDSSNELARRLVEDGTSRPGGQ